MRSSDLKIALLSLVTWIVIAMLIYMINSCGVQSVKAEIPEKQLTDLKQQRIINAYSNLLHRIWLDKPSYVEDVLWEYDEMLELDELLEGEWDKTFEFWNRQDSIEYHLNWNHIDQITKICQK